MNNLFLTALVMGLLVALAAALRIEDISEVGSAGIEEAPAIAPPYQVPSDWSLMLYSLRAQMVNK